MSAEILAEYLEVLSRPKFQLTEAQRQRWHDLMKTVATLMEVPLPLDFPRDPKDARFLACAQAAEADDFITGDRDFVEAQKLVTTTILSVSLFKKLVVDTAV